MLPVRVRSPAFAGESFRSRARLSRAGATAPRRGKPRTHPGLIPRRRSHEGGRARSDQSGRRGRVRRRAQVEAVRRRHGSFSIHNPGPLRASALAELVPCYVASCRQLYKSRERRNIQSSPGRLVANVDERKTGVGCHAAVRRGVAAAPTHRAPRRHARGRGAEKTSISLETPFTPVAATARVRRPKTSRSAPAPSHAVPSPAAPSPGPSRPPRTPRSSCPSRSARPPRRGSAHA